MSSGCLACSARAWRRMSSPRSTTRPGRCWRATPTTRVWRADRVHRRQRARGDDLRRPSGVHRSQRRPEPAGGAPATSLSGRVGAGFDPVRRNALRDRARRRARSASWFFCWAQGADLDEAPRSGRALPRPGSCSRGSSSSRAQRWQTLLGQVQVETPRPELDLLLNGWLLYQTLACRIWARSAFYQSGGAYRLPRPAAGRDGARPHRARDRRASRSCARQRASSSRATCSTGGTRRPAAASARGSPTTTCGCRSSPTTMCAATGDTGDPRRTGPVPRRPAAEARRGRVLRSARRLARSAARSTSTACGRSTARLAGWGRTACR